MQSQPVEQKWNLPEKTKVTVRVTTNCDEVELFLNKRSLGKKNVSHNLYTNDWEVESKTGELKAVGYLKGRQVVTSMLSTTAKATKLQLSPLPLPVVSDILLYELTICDNKGLKVIDSQPTVKVLVEGAGRLVGVDSGDLVYDGLFKTDTRIAWQGRLLVAVKRTAAAGEIRVTASSPGLSSAISFTK